MNNILKENFLVYSIGQTNTYIAIPYTFQRFIRQCLVEYQGLSMVPPDKRVKGVLFKVLDHNCFELSTGGEEEEVAINSLQFETGNIRLTA